MRKDSELFTFIKNFKDWTTIKTRTHELNYHFESDDDNIYLFFQESNGKKDWKDNLIFFPIPCKVYKRQENHMLCHMGFVREYKSGHDQIMSELIKLYEVLPNRKVIITGWSNGAAMATLAAEDFYYRTGCKPIVITFGNPQVCFDPFTAHHILNCCDDFREYCNVNDIVTKVPPFYFHVHKINVGNFKLFGIFNPWKYHTNYDKDIEEK
ncbi:MAG: lipase family protein [Treponema sp.]|nr:lipase family protein [Candidatus Treponema merdequi]